MKAELPKVPIRLLQGFSVPMWCIGGYIGSFAPLVGGNSGRSSKFSLLVENYGQKDMPCLSNVRAIGL